MADISTDLSQCASDPGDIINDLTSAVQQIQQGITVQNVEAAFEDISSAINEINQVVDACQAVINSYQTIEAEFTNVAAVLADPASYVSVEDIVRVIWNYNSMSNDITSLIHQI